MGPRSDRRRRDTVRVYRGRDGRWYWQRLNGYNHQIVATAGQGYMNRSHAVAMAKKINRRARLEVDSD